jgi:hypothetical protein
MRRVRILTRTIWQDHTNVLLLRKGHVLNPSSRLRYRWLRLRLGKSIGMNEPEPLAGLTLMALRLATMPVLTAVDYIVWPLALRTVARGMWYVVTVSFEGLDASFERIAEAETFDEIKARRRELERAAS